MSKLELVGALRWREAMKTRLVFRPGATQTSRHVTLSSFGFGGAGGNECPRGGCVGGGSARVGGCHLPRARARGKLDLYLPVPPAAGKLSPAVVWIHGGGWAGGVKTEGKRVFDPKEVYR